MLAAAERWGAGEDERPYLPRAFSYARFERGEAHFLLEDVGPGTRRCASSKRASSCGCSGHSAKASMRPRTVVERFWSVAEWASPRLPSGRTGSSGVGETTTGLARLS